MKDDAKLIGEMIKDRELRELLDEISSHQEKIDELLLRVSARRKALGLD